MARASQQSSGAITVWMIVFAALWLTSTVFLIILYTGQEDLVSANKRLTEAHLRLVSPKEERTLPLLQNRSANGPTLVGILEGARLETTMIATGDESDDPSTVRAKRDTLFDEIGRGQLLRAGTQLAEASLLEGAKLLTAALRSASGRVVELTERVAQLDSEVRALEETVATERQGFEENTKKLEARVAKTEESRIAYQNKQDDAIGAIQDDFEKSREESTRQITSERERSAQLERNLEVLRGRLIAQDEKSGGLSGGPDSLVSARSGDGIVLTAVAGDDVVYINLGQKDRLTLGLQFAVYAAEDGIPANGRAKAQIEVVSIFKDSAECKIVRRHRGSAVFEGDVIANPIYDAHRPRTFMVVGEFDVNRDGRPDRGGAKVIESLVSKWGGVLTKDLTVLTDFVVLGASPKRPFSGSSRSLTVEQSERRARQQQAWSRYGEIVSSARALSVPILSHELFLNFLGYRVR